MKMAGNAEIIAGLGREFGESEPVVIFVKARRLAELPRAQEYAEVDYRDYVRGGEHVLPDYVRFAAFKLLEMVADSS